MRKYVYHPDFGFDDQFRLRVLLDSVAHGVEKAAQMHGVHFTTVYGWRRRYVSALQNLKWSG